MRSALALILLTAFSTLLLAAAPPPPPEPDPEPPNPKIKILEARLKEINDTTPDPKRHYRYASIVKELERLKRRR